MAYHCRIESKEFASFLTTRTRNCELWFVNNLALEEAILGYTAKFTDRYKVKLYALAIEGNHIQGPAHFPEGNRAHFMRDLNSCVARAVPQHTPEYPGGRLWGRRYSNEFLMRDADIEQKFFYTVLQPVNDGLVDRIADYPGYNCFHDAANGISRKFKVIRWAEYNAARRRDPSVPIKDFTEHVELKFERLPGYDHLSQREYARMMNTKLEIHRLAALEKRKAGGKELCLGRESLKKISRGTPAKNPKVSGRNSFRPRILSSCPEAKDQGLSWYFGIFRAYRAASIRYRSGELTAQFPPGTYRPIVHQDYG